MASRWNKQRVLRNVDLAQIRLKEASLRLHENKNIPQNIIEAFDAISGDSSSSSSPTPNATLVQYKNYAKNFNVAFLKSIASEIFTILLNPLLIVDNAVEEAIMLIVNATFMAECGSTNANTPVVNAKGTLDLSAVSTADALWKNSDPALEETEIIMPIDDSEGFVTLAEDDLKTFIETNAATLNSFKESNPWINSGEEDWTPAVAIYFSNSYQDFVDSPEYTTMDYIEFVDRINKKLSNADVIKEIKGLHKPDIKPKSTVGGKRPPKKRTIRAKPTAKPTDAPKKAADKIDPVQKTKTLCEEARLAAIDELKKDMKNIKQFIYELAVLPMMMLVVYNLYFMFFIKKDNLYSYVDGNNIMHQEGCEQYKFPDWEKLFRKYEQHYTNIISEFFLKPSQLMGALLNGIGHSGTLRDINAKYPYLVYFALFAIILFNWGYITNEISTVMKGFFFGSSMKHTKIYQFASVSSWIYFVIHLIISFILFMMPFEVPPDKLHMSLNPIISVFFLALKIVIWIVKGMVVASTIELSAFILAMYLIYVSIFSIYMNKKTVGHGLNDIFQKIYTKFYEPFTGDAKDLLNMVLVVLLQIFNYTFEIFATIIIVTNAHRCVTGLQSNELKSILTLITIVLLLLMGGWTAYKTFRVMPNVDKNYDKVLLGGEKTVLQNPASMRVAPSPGCRIFNISHMQYMGAISGTFYEVSKTEESMIIRIASSFLGKDTVNSILDASTSMISMGKEYFSKLFPKKTQNQLLDNVANKMDSVVANPQKLTENIKQLVPESISSMIPQFGDVKNQVTDAIANGKENFANMAAPLAQNMNPLAQNMNPQAIQQAMTQAIPQNIPQSMQQFAPMVQNMNPQAMQQFAQNMNPQAMQQFAQNFNPNIIQNLVPNPTVLQNMANSPTKK